MKYSKEQVLLAASDPAVCIWDDLYTKLGIKKELMAVCKDNVCCILCSTSLQDEVNELLKQHIIVTKDKRFRYLSKRAREGNHGLDAIFFSPTTSDVDGIQISFAS